MKNLILMLLPIMLASCAVQQIPANELDTLDTVSLFETTDDFMEGRKMAVPAGILIKNQSEQHLTIKGVFDLRTGQKIKRGISVWAIEYKGAYFFNLGYSSDLNNWSSFVKLDLLGRYCATIIHRDSPDVLKFSSNNSGGGIAGFLIAESGKWGKNWEDKDGNKKKILLIDTKNISQGFASRNTGSMGNYLRKTQLKQIATVAGSPLPDDNPHKPSFEKVMELINTANNKSLSEVSEQIEPLNQRP